MPLRLVMMGTGVFALPTFQALCQSKHDVVGLFTQPDRRGRGHHNHPHPMKEAAEAHGVPVFQPQNVNSAEGVEQLRQCGPQLCVVAAYGQILSAELLQVPPLGFINLHASLLPKYRGAAPIPYAILHGESETGVTIFQIEPKLDAGDMLGQVRTPIGKDETAGDLERRLADLAVPLTLGVLERLESGTEVREPQDASRVTRAPRMRKEFGEIDWSKTAAEVDCHVRAMQPWPKPYSTLQQPDRQPMRLLVLRVAPCSDESGFADDASPGTVVHVDSRTLVVRCRDRCLRLETLQPEGKRPMNVEAFLCGRSVRVGDRFVHSDDLPA